MYIQIMERLSTTISQSWSNFQNLNKISNEDCQFLIPHSGTHVLVDVCVLGCGSFCGEEISLGGLVKRFGGSLGLSSSLVKV